MKFSRRTLVLSWVGGLSSLALGGCGYQLRGLTLSPEGSIVSQLAYHRVYLLAEDTEEAIVKALSRLIRGLGAELVDSPMKAEIEVVLGSSQWATVTSAIGSYGEISARLVILTQSIQVRQIGQDHWLVDTQIRRSREIDQASSLITGLGAERPLAIARESDEVTNDVRQRVVEALVRIIQRLAPLSPAKKESSKAFSKETSS